MARRRLTDAEREERRRKDRERLEQATRELLTSEGWQRWVEVRRQNGLSRYSVGNQILIAMEMHRRGAPPRYVAGFRWWSEHGYQVRRGEKAIRILGPVRRRVEDPKTGEKEHRVVGFRGVPVFELSQVDAGPEAVPLAPPPSAPLSGEEHAHRGVAIEELLEGLGCSVRYEQMAAPHLGAGGYYSSRANEVVIEGRLSGNAKLRVLLHEAGHALVDRELLAEDERLSYGTEEVLVETIGYIAASSVGLDTEGQAVSYVAGWSDGDAGQISRMAELIDRGARRLEEAMDVAAGHDEQAVSPAVA